MKSRLQRLMILPLLLFVLGAEEQCENAPGGLEPGDPGGPVTAPGDGTAPSGSGGGAIPAPGDPLPSDPGGPIPPDIPDTEGNQPENPGGLS